LEGVADAASDQFSFCVALYERLFEQHPFAKGTPSEVVGRMASGEILPPPAGSGVPSRVRRAVLRGLSARREDRFPDMSALLAELAYDPGAVRRRRLGVAAGVAAVVLLAVSVHTLMNRRAALCSGGDQRLAAFWNQGRRESLREHFGSLGAHFPADAAQALIRAVDARGRSWVEAYTEVCAASRLRGEVSSDVMDRQMACLEQRLEETRRLLELLGNADVELAASAADAVAALPGLQAFMSSAEMLEEDPLPEDPTRRQEIKAAREDLAQGEALKAAGRFQEALATALEVSKTAGGLGFDPLEAQARFLAGNVAIELGQTETAERELRAALTAAGKGGARRLAVWIANDLTWLYGVMKSEVDRALWWSDLAESWAGRLQSAEAEMWEILSTRADLLETAGRAREALELQQRLSEQALNEGHRDDEMAAHAHLGVADALYHVGEYREALGHYRLAAAIREQLMGPDHPQVAVVLVSLGSVLTQLSQYDEALPVLKRALDINERVFGPDSPVLSANLNNIASALEGMQRYEEALAVHKRGIDLVTRAWGPDHPQTAFTHLNTLSVYRQLGRLDEALVEAREARRVLVKAYGPDHPLCAYAENAEGVMYLLMGQPRKAVGPLERAVAIREKAGVDELAAAESRFSLAKAVWELGQRDRARRLARKARETFVADGTQRGREDVALLDEWSAQHR
jgi:tetratricopeptide (TPR) repeat protein